MLVRLKGKSRADCSSLSPAPADRNCDNCIQKDYEREREREREREKRRRDYVG